MTHSEEIPFGARLRALRERTGKTRPVLGQLVGRSSDWVKSLEGGKILQPRMPMLIRLAEALGLSDLSELTGSQRIPIGAITKAPVPGMESVTAALLKPVGSGPSPIPVAELIGRVDTAWQTWHQSAHERTTIAGVLPELVAVARASALAAEGADHRRAKAELARVYHLVQLLNAYQPAEQLSWLSADRAFTAAQEADDPVAQAIAAWYYAHLYRSSGQTDLAVDMLTAALSQLQPGESPDAQAVWGQLHLGLALAHAKAGTAGAAWRHWDTTSAVARNLGEAYHHPWLMYGVAAVDIYRVTIETDLQRFGEAEQAAKKVALRTLPSHTRRAFFLIEQARQRRSQQDDVGVIYHLTKALRESHDTTTHHPRRACRDRRACRSAGRRRRGRPGALPRDRPGGRRGIRRLQRSRQRVQQIAERSDVLLRCGTPDDLARRPDHRLRITLGLRKEAGRWLIAHEHHSFPLAEPADRAAAELEIRALHERWFERTAAKDLDGLMAGIADDVVSYEHIAPLEHIGRAQVRRVCRDGLEAGTGEVTWQIREPHRHHCGRPRRCLGTQPSASRGPGRAADRDVVPWHPRVPPRRLGMVEGAPAPVLPAGPADRDRSYRPAALTASTRP
jgi:ketosteroid isomerase-like protein/transcriptional regulator with XRE-family HTH domain